MYTISHLAQWRGGEKNYVCSNNLNPFRCDALSFVWFLTMRCRGWRYARYFLWTLSLAVIFLCLDGPVKRIQMRFKALSLIEIQTMWMVMWMMSRLCSMKMRWLVSLSIYFVVNTFWNKSMKEFLTLKIVQKFNALNTIKYLIGLASIPIHLLLHRTVNVLKNQQEKIFTQKCLVLSN